MAQVGIRDLSVRFGKQDVIDGLSLTVADGEFLVLLGPSGCGKSTLLHSIAGLNEVTAGTIEIGGVDMTHADPKDRGIGMVFQSYALYPTMSVRDNMSFGLRVSRVPRDEIERRVSKAAELLQLSALLGRRPAQLSGGQRQRVAIGRALVREAGVFLFDEPLSNLDAKLRTELRRELKLLHKTLGTTMIYVTHDQVEAMTLATRIVVMRQGVIQQIGTPTDVYERPDNLFVAGFLGAPAMNFIEGELQEEHGELHFSAGALRLPLTGKWSLPSAQGRGVVIGLRPEHLRIDDAGSHAVRITLVEPMGNHDVVWVDWLGHPLSLIGHRVAEQGHGGEARLAVDAGRALLFDKSSGQRIRMEGES